MPRYTFTRTDTYHVQVDAASEDEAEALARELSYEDPKWQLDDSAIEGPTQ